MLVVCEPGGFTVTRCEKLTFFGIFGLFSSIFEAHILAHFGSFLTVFRVFSFKICQKNFVLVTIFLLFRAFSQKSHIFWEILRYCLTIFGENTKSSHFLGYLENFLINFWRKPKKLTFFGIFGRFLAEFQKLTFFGIFGIFRKCDSKTPPPLFPKR